MCALGLQVWRELLGTGPRNASVRRRHRIAEKAEEGKLEGREKDEAISRKRKDKV